MNVELTIYHINGTKQGSTTTPIRQEARSGEANKQADKAFIRYCKARGLDRSRHYWVWAI